MKKEIRFSAKIDTAEFDRTVEQMQRRLAKVYEASDRSRMSNELRGRLSEAGLGKPFTPQEKARQEADDRRSQRELRAFIREQVKEHEQINKKIEERIKKTKELKDEIKKIGDHESEITKNKLKEIREIQTQIDQLRQRAGAKEAGITEGLDVLGRVPARRFDDLSVAARAFGMGRYGAAGGALVRAAGGWEGIATGAGRALLGGSQIAQYFNEQRGRIAEAQGAAAQGLIGRELRDYMGGRGFSRFAFSQERAQAAKEVVGEMKNQRMIDTAMIAGAALVGVGGILSLTGAGAAVGVPAMGMGAKLMAGAAVVGGAATILGSERLKAKTLSPFSTGAEQEYEAMLTQKQAIRFNQRLESLKNMAPVRTAVMEEFAQRAGTDQAVQRALGLSDKELTQMYTTGTRFGFTTGRTAATTQAILEAGGSTEAARGWNVSANLFARNLNATNAPQNIGRLSQFMAGESAFQTQIKMVAAGVKIGLDTSEFAAENRKFTAIATDAIVSSGATSKEGAARVLAGFAAPMADRTMAGIEGAKKAYEAYQQITAETGGARGAIQAAAMLKSPMLRRLSRDELAMFQGLTEAQIRSGDARAQGLLASINMNRKPGEAMITMDDFIKEASRVKREGITTRADTSGLGEQIKAKYGTIEGAQKSTAGQALVSRFQSQLVTTGALDQMSDIQQRQFMERVIKGEMTAEDEKKWEEATKETKEKLAKDPERRADIKEALDAIGETIFLKNIEAFDEQLKNSTDGARAFAEAANKAATELEGAFKTRDTARIEAALNKLADVLQVGTGKTPADAVNQGSSNQTKGGSPWLSQMGSSSE